jgi:hypothetical protein
MQVPRIVQAELEVSSASGFGNWYIPSTHVSPAATDRAVRPDRHACAIPISGGPNKIGTFESVVRVSHSPLAWTRAVPGPARDEHRIDASAPLKLADGDAFMQPATS